VELEHGAVSGIRIGDEVAMRKTPRQIVDAPMPRLSKVITRCIAAKPSTTRGVPVVQDGSQVNEESYRGAGSFRPELSKRELNSACGDRSRRHVRPIDRQVLRVLMLLSVAVNVTSVLI
jgi:hypothetical protein